MRIKLLSLALLLLSGNLQAATKFEHWKTSQGVPVYYLNTPDLPMVDIRVAFDAGSARDEKQYGIASLTSSLLDTGAGKWNADDIAQRFESVGAQFGVGASTDSASLSLRTLVEPKLFNKALETMQVILTQPTFAKADFERKQKQMLAGLKHREESPASIAGLAFDKALYGDHPYAYPSSGYTETVSKFKAADAKTFYQRYYVSTNAMVVIVGALDKKLAKETAEKLMAKLPKGEKTTP
ncbi:MAG: insulinase family protein, partial [Methylococcaceae bacterium]|nr:insulinase family protein [Methylococcaceae bacterium]